MRLSNAQAVARPSYFDRNPVPKNNSFGGSAVAPHAATQRISYTVPAGKKAYFEMVTLLTRVAAAAAPRAITEVFCQYTPSGGVASSVARVQQLSNTVAQNSDTQLPIAWLMLAGDAVTVSSQDTSTGGSVDYALSLKFLEFDA